MEILKHINQFNVYKVQTVPVFNKTLFRPPISWSHWQNNDLVITTVSMYLGLALAAQAKLSMRSWPCILAASSLVSNRSSRSIISESSSKSVKWLFTQSRRMRVTWYDRGGQGMKRESQVEDILGEIDMKIWKKWVKNSGLKFFFFL